MLSQLSQYLIQMKQKGQHIGLKLRTYNFISLLGVGAWASVYQIFDTKTGDTYACKVIAKKLMEETPKLKQLVQTQVTVLKRCKSQNVIKYIDSFFTEKEVYIFTEFCNGGDMEEYLKKKKRLAEDESREFLKQIINGFKGLHAVGAMHRDFKTANILLHNGLAKIADLGFSKILKEKKMTATILGTSVTMAPELLENKQYGMQCDVWSVGVVYYQLLIGDYPYNGINDNEILKKIKSYPPRFPETIVISQQSKDFIRKCLTIDPKKRLAWKDMYQHPLIAVKNNPRQTYLGSLTSHINLDDNKDFYNKYEGLNANLHGGEMESFKEAKLEQSLDLDRIQEQLKKKKAVQAAITRYSQLYLQRRNKVMLAVKYGISPIFQLQGLPIDQNLHAFLMGKRAFLETREFRKLLRERKNMFKLTNYFQEFLKSEEYAKLVSQVDVDYEFITAYTQSFMYSIKTKNPTVQEELTLEKVTDKFNSLYKQELTSYVFKLYDYRDNPNIKKSVLFRLMTFVSDLVSGIYVSSESYDRRMESLQIKQMETTFAKKFKEMYTSHEI